MLFTTVGIRDFRVFLFILSIFRARTIVKPLGFAYVCGVGKLVMSTSTSVVDVPLVCFVIIIFVGAVEGIVVGFTALAALLAALPEAAEAEAVAAGATNTTPVVTLYATS